MKWQDMKDYDGDFALVKFQDPKHQEDPPLVGVAIKFGNCWKEPYTAIEYVNNFGKPLIPISWVNLDELSASLR